MTGPWIVCISIGKGGIFLNLLSSYLAKNMSLWTSYLREISPFKYVLIVYSLYVNIAVTYRREYSMGNPFMVSLFFPINFQYSLSYLPQGNTLLGMACRHIDKTPWEVRSSDSCSLKSVTLYSEWSSHSWIPNTWWFCVSDPNSSRIRFILWNVF